jgi:hypothetical protein
MMNGEGGRIAEETRVENVFDRVETTGTLWLGLTIGCCRCHDHKFDPLTQADYFSMYDFFNQTSETGQIRGGQAEPALDMSTPAEKERLQAAQKKVEERARLVEAFEVTKFPRPEGAPLTESEAAKLPGNLPQYIAKTVPNKRGVDPLLEAIAYFKDKDAAYSQLLQGLLKDVRARDGAAKNITRVMVMDTLPKPRETFLLSKGAYDKPLETKATARTPVSLPPMAADAPHDRLGLAKWLVARENPLTARVTVNRFWQAFFGLGLVKTVDDFGVQGEKPSHPELLDWLAVRFQESGWNVKALHKLIVMSATYRQDSSVTPKLRERDPENRLLAHGPRFRLPSWMIRDQALAASGLLVDKLGGPAVMPYQPEGIWEEATFGKKSYKQDHGDALYRRSLYAFWRRIVGPTLFVDNTARQTCYVRPIRTNTPLHALVTMNDVTYVEAARAMAERVLHLGAEDDWEALSYVFRLVTSRYPTAQEGAVLSARLGKLRQTYGGDAAAVNELLAAGEQKRDEKLDPAEHAAWTALCLVLLNLDEAITKG